MEPLSQFSYTEIKKRSVNSLSNLGRFALVFTFAITLPLTASSAITGKCLFWNEAQKVSRLNSESLPEISGISISKKYDRIYYLNDSEKIARLYYSKLDGSHLKHFDISGIKFRDTEALSLASCPGNTHKDCLFIADIGDNLKKRSSISIYILEEKEEFQQSEPTVQVISLKYPNQSYNAESFAVHPVNGDFIIITKEMPESILNKKSSKIFRLENSQLKIQKTHTLEFVKELDLSALQPKPPSLTGTVTTDLSISQTANSFLLLTYDYAFEFFLDLSQIQNTDLKKLKEGRDYEVLRIKHLPQQEAITYHPSSKYFYYTSEMTPDLMRAECLSD